MQIASKWIWQEEIWYNMVWNDLKVMWWISSVWRANRKMKIISKDTFLQGLVKLNHCRKWDYNGILNGNVVS